jgi:inhibitor of cysteine peptidase
MPPLKGGVEGKIVEVGYHEFLEKKTITREIETTVPGSIVVSLASNPTTGFSWAENTVISDPSVIKQVEHNYVAPTAGSPPGSPGKDVWTLDSLKAGTATVTMSYSRPWEGGEKNEWTFTLNVTILPNK